MDIRKRIVNIAKKAKASSLVAASLPSELKNRVIMDMAAALLRNKGVIIKANARDLKAAKSGSKTEAFIDRLRLDDKRIKQMSDSLSAVSKLADPVGKVIGCVKRPNGLKIEKVRVPIGVISVIYESRPNVTSDCAGLCFKSGNSVILRGGSDSLNSNKAIHYALSSALKKNGLPQDIVSLVDVADHHAVDILLGLEGYIDLVMPRGGEALIRRVARVSRIPVIKHYKGICHVYVDEWADLNMAEKVCFNAKVQRPGVCNAMESMLVHRDVATRFLPGMIRSFRKAGVEIRGCQLTRRIVKSGVRRASEKDYRSEYLDLILSVKVVNSLEQAVKHINDYGSHHSDSIITDCGDSARMFLARVDSACVYHNASTRFTDGFEFGMGAEIGISTDKLHARGPMGLEELTSYKYVIKGRGQIRQ